MAKASINFAKASSGGMKHNDRTEKKEPEYLLPEKYRLKNEVDVSAQGAEKKIQDLYSAAKDNYQEKFGQKLQAKVYTWEAVINLNKEHTLEDVQRLAKEIEKETGFTSVQIAIHRDEGRMEKSKAGEIVPIYNLHAHVTFFTLDKETGQQLYRKSLTPKQKEQQPNLKPMNRARLSALQTLTSETLGMERGKVSIDEEARKLWVKPEKASVRLGHREFRATQKELAKQKDLKAEVAKLRAELQANKATRADYAELEAFNKELKAEVKSKTLTISALEAKISDFKTLDVEIPQKEDKNDLKAISETLEGANADVPSDYDLEEAQRFGAGFEIHRFIEDKGTKGKRVEKINWRSNMEYPTVTFDTQDLEKLKEKLNEVDRKQIGLARKALNAYNHIQTHLSKIKKFIKEKITPKKERTPKRELSKEREGMQR